MARKPEYDAKFVVKFYAHFVEGLMKGEQMIIDTMGDQLPDWKMLDIGIGAGRTTRHFAPRVKEYLGVDYVPGMIEVVKRKFPSPEPHVRFEVADAQSMPQISDQYYDLSLQLQWPRLQPIRRTHERVEGDLPDPETGRLFSLLHP